MGTTDGELVLQQLNGAENAALGFAAGAIEAVSTQPLTYWKNASQQGLPLTLNPKLLYRGTLVSALNDGTLTAAQFFLAGFFQKAFTGGAVRELTAVETVGSAFAGGVLSGVPCCVLELTMIQQQRFGGSFLGTPLRLVRARGGFDPLALFRGFVPTALREGFFTVGYLGLAPLIERAIETHLENQRRSGRAEGAWISSMTPFQRNFVASTAAGLGAAALTHPADTIKSCMQGDTERKTYGSVLQTARTLYAKGGYGAFFNGYAARAAMIAACFLIFNEAKVRLAPVFFPSKMQTTAATAPSSSSSSEEQRR